ncbi:MULTISPECIES: hypothetical protein [unclassified Bradyrhizobium]|uniref:hypothetical protein n=1 Tax=unclassified Bradyrhizobium TaxID=2631580 RepID=UPI002915E837|nr:MULTISPECIES: hypothetical protein [unclassified Bradyrhizobium]
MSALLDAADWRLGAVERAYKILERALTTGFEEGAADIEHIAEALRQENSIPESGPEARLDNESQSLMIDSIVGEAAGLLLIRNTGRNAWTMAVGLRSHFDSMLAALRGSLKSKYDSDDQFRLRFDDLADGVSLEAATQRPAEDHSARSNVLALAENWREAPNLRDVWSGIHWLRPDFGPNEINILAYIYVALNKHALAGFLDRFDNPYQVWDILSGWAQLGLEQTFAVWSELFLHAEPSFNKDGSWTGKTLEALLLVVAEDALKEARLPKEATDDLVRERGEEFRLLTERIGEIIAQKPTGSSLALRWSAQLFRKSAGGSDQELYPRDLRQQTTALWCMLEALGRSDAAIGWNDIGTPDAMPEEVLCILAAKIVAANERKSELPAIRPLLDCCPDEPENFLGTSAIQMRAMTLPFSTYNTRPDALKFRVFGLLFFQGDPVELYRDLWRRTLTLRELAEHWQSGEQDDGRSDAKQVLAMVLAIGINILDLYADARSAGTGNVQRNADEFGRLFEAIYNSLRELQAIELFKQSFWSTLFTHLIVRRVIYERSQLGDFELAAPLRTTARPTLSEMLADAAGIRQPFFLALDNLIRNGLSSEKIAEALSSTGIDLLSFIDAANRLNEIDERRQYGIEAAEQIAHRMRSH